MTTSYPKRLIEVDLPIKRISAHARREKSIRHGHISTLHIWWARRPLAACRAVICAALWPDPADPLCPVSFREVARTQMLRWAAEHRRLLSPESFKRFNSLGKDPNRLSDPLELRQALLDFIADFANWDNSTSKEYLETSRTLTWAAHEALGGEPGTRPLVVDPFAGGGAIPLEALRVGADAFASDLNPVAVLLNKVVLEYIPRYGQQLADEARKWGQWIQEQAEQELSQFYPKDPDGATPIAYLWARTIRCEGPGCGTEIPLLRSLWLAKRGTNSVALKLVPDREKKQINFEIINGGQVYDAEGGTVRRGSAICPVCGYTTPVTSVRQQIKKNKGNTTNAMLFAVVTTQPGKQGRFYRTATERDVAVIHDAASELEHSKQAHVGPLSLVPDETTPLSAGHRAVSSLVIYGIENWSHLFTPRQALTLVTLIRLVNNAGELIEKTTEKDLRLAAQTCLALAVDRLADRCSSLCRWDPSPAASGILNTFTRQALPFVWDFAEGVPLESKSGGWLPTLEWIEEVIDHESVGGIDWGIANTQQASAITHPLPDASAETVQ